LQFLYSHVAGRPHVIHYDRPTIVDLRQCHQWVHRMSKARRKRQAGESSSTRHLVGRTTTDGYWSLFRDDSLLVCRETAESHENIRALLAEMRKKRKLPYSQLILCFSPNDELLP
jgi:hypothetical protein